MKIDFDMNRSLIIVVVLLMPCCCIHSLIIPKSNPIGECSHLSSAEDQTNFYTTKDERVCCMCPAGSRVSNDCSIDNPNTTRCEPCEYNDHVKTYINYEPHSQRECYKDTTSCMEHMVAVGGSPTSKARCDCPQGHRKINDWLCEKMSENMNNAPEPTHQSITEKDVSTEIMIGDKPETTPAVPQSMNTWIISTILPPQTNFDVTVFHSTADTYNATLNSTDVHFENRELKSVNFIAAILVPLLCITILVVVFCLWKRGCFKDLYCCCTFNEVLPSNQEVEDPPIDSSEKNINSAFYRADTNSRQEGLPLMKDDGRTCIDVDENTEKIPPDNYVEAFIANGNNVQCRTCHANLNQPQVEQGPRQVEIICPNRRLTEEQEKKRRKVFMKVADEITMPHLSQVGRTLLYQRTRSFDDIYNNRDSTFEKAMKIFNRSVQINPQLSVTELGDIFERFRIGYLKDIVDDSLREDRNVGG